MFKGERQQELDVDMTKYRTYDYAIGRFWQVDPRANELTDFTPYNYSFNNPVRYNDPEGDCPPWLCGALVSGATEVLTQVTVNVITGNDITDIDWADVGTAALAGGVSGGLKTVAQVASAGRRINSAIAKTKKVVSVTEEAAKAGVDSKVKDGKLQTQTVGGVGGFNEKDAVNVVVDVALGSSGSGAKKISSEAIDLGSEGLQKSLERQVKRTATGSTNNLKAKSQKAILDSTNEGNKKVLKNTIAVGAGVSGSEIKEN